MKLKTLFRALLPATLFLLGSWLWAQDMETMTPTDGGTEAAAPDPAPGAAAATAANKVKLTPREQALLERFDTNHDGVLDDDELAAAQDMMRGQMQANRLENARKLYARLLSQFDTEKKGSLNPEEQAQAVAALQQKNPKVYKMLLQRFDKDGDGKLDGAETQAMFDQLAQIPQAGAPEKGFAASPQPTAGRGAMARKLYDGLLARFDTTHRGFLNAEEQAQAVEALKTERPVLYQHLLGRFDANHDGQLDAAETQNLFDTLGDIPPMAAGQADLPKEKS